MNTGRERRGITPRELTSALLATALLVALAALVGGLLWYAVPGPPLVALGSTARYACIPGYSAEIRPSGELTATGYSQHCLIAKRGLIDAHLMAYPGEIVIQRLISGQMIPTADANVKI
jgi:hypothetical protein